MINSFCATMFNNLKNSVNALSIMTTIFLLALILSNKSVQYANAATALEEVEENPAHPDKCFVRETGIAHTLGSSWQVPDMVCTQASCYKSGSPNKFLIEYQTCGVVSAEPPCRIVEDLNLPYPACCPRFQCPTSSRYEDNFLSVPKSFQGPLNDQRTEADSLRSNQITDSGFDFTGQQLTEPLMFKKQLKLTNKVSKRPSSILDILGHDYETYNGNDDEHMMSGSPYGTHSLLMMDARTPQIFHSNQPEMSQTTPVQLTGHQASYQRSKGVVSLIFPESAMNAHKSHRVTPNVYQQTRTDENNNQDEDQFAVSYDVTLGEDEFENEVLQDDSREMYSLKASPYYQFLTIA